MKMPNADIRASRDRLKAKLRKIRSELKALPKMKGGRPEGARNRSLAAQHSRMAGSYVLRGRSDYKRSTGKAQVPGWKMAELMREAKAKYPEARTKGINFYVTKRKRVFVP
jgi:hypothetical protein